MQTDHKEIYKKMFGDIVATETISIDGLKEKAKVDIYDGMAIGSTKSGKQIQMEFPKLQVVKTSKELGDELMKYLGDITDIGEVTPIQCMQTFATVYVDGVKLDKCKKS